MQKQLEEQSILMSSADRVAHIDGQAIVITNKPITLVDISY